jgi:recombination protein RecA
MKKMGKLNSKVGGVEQTVGIKTRVQVIKNRMGPPLRTIDFEIYFDRGIDRYGSWLNTMKTYKLVKQGGAWYTWVDELSGEELKFQAKTFEDLLETRPEVKEQMYKQICDAYILGYKEASDAANIDTTEFDDKVEI